MSISIEVSDIFITINGKRFLYPPGFAVIAKMLGAFRSKNPIVTAAKSTIHTFDDAGIWIHEENSIVTQISILFSEPFLDFHPKSTFLGQLVIKSIPIQKTEDVLKIKYDEIWLDEWEAEGSADIFLQKIMLNLNVDLETKTLDTIDFWFKNTPVLTKWRQLFCAITRRLAP